MEEAKEHTVSATGQEKQAPYPSAASITHLSPTLAWFLNL